MKIQRRINNMLNLTSKYPTQTFLPVSASLLMAQVDHINSTGIINKDFPKKLRRPNTGGAPDGSGAPISQIDVLINPDPRYAFQSLKDAQAYAFEGASQMVNNACFYIENNQATQGYYQLVVWGLP
jgi:hypothetical protein